MFVLICVVDLNSWEKKIQFDQTEEPDLGSDDDTSDDDVAAAAAGGADNDEEEEEGGVHRVMPSLYKNGVLTIGCVG